MRCVLRGFVCAIVLVGQGCVTVPPISERDYVKVEDILYSVECELKEAVEDVSRHYPYAKNQLVTLIYGLKVAESGDGSGDANIVVPITNGTFSVGFTAGLSTRATRDTSITVSYNTANLECRAQDGGVTVPVRIEGGVGLYDWLLRTTQALAKAKETPTAMTYEVDFDITAGASVNPKFGIQQTSGHQYGGGIVLAGTRARSHSVQVSVAEIKAGNVAAAQKRLDQEVLQFRLKDRRD